MTIQEIQQHVGGDPIVIAALQQQMNDANEQADKLALVAATARATAREQEQVAADAEDRGLALRDAAERFRRHLDMERSAPGDVPGERINDEGDVQTTLIPRPAMSRPYDNQWPAS